MKPLRVILSMLAALLTMASCHEKDDPVPDTRPSRTVLVYMVADNSLNSQTNGDIDEMMQGILNVDETQMKSNLLLYVDDYNTPKLYHISSANGVAQKTLVHSFSEELTSTDADVFADVLGMVTSRYAADSYGLVYWSHGDGWMPSTLMKMRSTDLRWIGQDVNNGGGTYHYGDIDDTAATVKSVVGRVDFVLFDACYMLTTEVAYAFKDCTGYVIGSPTEIPGPGAPYDKILPYMFSPQSTYVTDIARAYFDYYNDKYADGKGLANDNWTGGVSIGVMSTSAVTALADATAAALASAGDADPAALRQTVLDYDKRVSTRSHIGYYDFYGMMATLLPAAELSAWQSAYGEALTYWQTTARNYSAFAGMFSMENAKGAAQYIPVSASLADSKDTAYHSTGWYQAAGLSQLGW